LLINTLIYVVIGHTKWAQHDYFHLVFPIKYFKIPLNYSLILDVQICSYIVI
jgi:hypothetical protein